MEKPWFNLNPNNFKDRWWLYSEILDRETNKKLKNEDDILCQLILQDINDMGHVRWRVSTWYENDPNRYCDIIFGHQWPFDIELVNMKEGHIIEKNNLKYKVHYCSFSNPNQIDYCKILERID